MREKTLGPIGEKEEIRTDLGLDSTYSVTLLTTVDPVASHPIVIDMRDESNSASDFLTIEKYWIENGHLTQGDYLIVDNSSIHVNDEIEEELDFMLPWDCSTHSPELNPCECDEVPSLILAQK